MNKITHKLLAVLAAALLILALCVPAFAVGGSTTVTAEVKHERTVTVRHTTHGQVIVLAPDPLHDGDTVVFTVTPDKGCKVSAVYLNGTDVTAQLVNGTYTTVVDGDMDFYAVFARVRSGHSDRSDSGKTPGKTVDGSKTGDMGVALYAASALLSAAGATTIAHRKKK